MCLPAAAIPLISAASSVVGFMGQAAQANAQNQAALNNAQSANLAAERKYEDAQRQYVYEARRTQQEGYSAAMKSREAAGTALASAGTSGVGGLSVGNILAAINQQGAENASRVSTKMDDLRAGYTSQVDSYKAEAQGRANSIPMSAGPNPLALGLNIVSSFAKNPNSNNTLFSS